MVADARAGGIEKLLATIFGEERAHDLNKPLSWLDRVRGGLSSFKPIEAVGAAGQTGLMSLKDKLEQITHTPDGGRP